MITSTNNPRIKHIRSLQNQARARREAGEFVVEGVRLVEEISSSGWPVNLVLHSSDLSPRGVEMLALFEKSGVEVLNVASHVLKSVSDTQSPQGILVVAKQRKVPFPEIVDFIIILDTVADPGNMGAILRTSAAAGVDAVCLSPGCTDLYAPKVLRAAMGAHFKIPIHQLDWHEIEHLCSQHQLRLFIASPKSKQIYTQPDFNIPCALMIGSEAHGTSSHGQNLPHIGIRIPIKSGVESLNAAAAAAVLLFEVVRQRS